MANMSKCVKCAKLKPSDAFYKMRSGSLLPQCKLCHNAKSRAYYAEYKDSMRESRARYYADNRERLVAARSAVDPDKAAERQRRYRAQKGNAEKVRARSAVGKAVSRGKMQKPAACSKCDRVGPVHGHHHDYSRPLDVRWLCVPCHWNKHLQERAAS